MQILVNIFEKDAIILKITVYYNHKSAFLL